jgi:hypothetical protein
MNTNEMIKASGRLNIQVIGPDGMIKDEQTVDNLVVSVGLNFIASRIRDASATVMSHMAVGSGTAPAASGNTALGTELGRVALTSTTATNNAVAFVAGVGTGAVTEAGLFNASTAGTMLCRTVFGVVNKEAADTMSITWTVTIGAA